MSQLASDLSDRIKLECCGSKCYGSHCVSVQDIQGAIQCLKAGKCDGAFSTDHILNADFDFIVHFSFLFTAMVRHGFAPSHLLKSTVVPTPKNLRKSVNDSTNYRGIALNSPFSFVVNEVIQEYLNGNSDVHVMLLDASKAFDCVNYVTLFSQLINKGFCP